MLQHFIRKAHNGKTWVSPRWLSAFRQRLPKSNDAPLKIPLTRAKASEVLSVEEAMAAAIGAGLPITEAFGNMIVDIGGGTTDIAVISLSGIVYSKSVASPATRWTKRFTQYIKRKYNLLIGERTRKQSRLN